MENRSNGVSCVLDPRYALVNDYSTNQEKNMVFLNTEIETSCYLDNNDELKTYGDCTVLELSRLTHKHEKGNLEISLEEVWKEFLEGLHVDFDVTKVTTEEPYQIKEEGDFIVETLSKKLPPRGDGKWCGLEDLFKNKFTLLDTTESIYFLDRFKLKDYDVDSIEIGYPEPDSLQFKLVKNKNYIKVWSYFFTNHGEISDYYTDLKVFDLTLEEETIEELKSFIEPLVCSLSSKDRETFLESLEEYVEHVYPSLLEEFSKIVWEEPISESSQDLIDLKNGFEVCCKRLRVDL